MTVPSPAAAPAQPALPGAARAAGAVVAALGCVLPWESLESSPPGDASSVPLDGLHGYGTLSCVAAAGALLLTAALLWRPGLDGLRGDGATSIAGLVVVAGAVLFLYAGGGYPLGSSVGGQSRVAVGPGLPVTVAGGLLLLGTGLTQLWSRRGASPPRRSAAARPPR